MLWLAIVIVKVNLPLVNKLNYNTEEKVDHNYNKKLKTKSIETDEIF
jgi:hypothetical protein